MKIPEIMKSPVQTIGPQATVQDLDALLAGRSISGVPIVSDDGELLGIVSKTDVIRQLVEDPDLYRKGTEVWRIMSAHVLWVSIDDDVREVAKKMLDAKVHRILVYDQAELAGIVSTYDFLKVVAGMDATTR